MQTTSESSTFDAGTGPSSPTRQGSFQPSPIHRTHTLSSTKVAAYFNGPRNVRHFSKWPLFSRVHGSTLPQMIFPLILVGLWSTLITCISKFAHELSVGSQLLTVMGLVVGFALSFKSSTGYARYLDGMNSWSEVTIHCRDFARLTWIYVKERHNDAEDPYLGRSDLLGKLTALRLLLAFAVSLKHQLRFEPATDYEDLYPLIDHLPTIASTANQAPLHVEENSWIKEVGEFLGISCLLSNPRKAVKRSKDRLGNMPLEILTYLSAYVEDASNNGSLTNGIAHANMSGSIAALTAALTQTQRLLHNPVPIAFNIAISQITWIYVMLLPFQLYDSFGWITIPSTIFATYITLSFAAIGSELEDPFGYDVNDLPLDTYCDDLAADIETLIASPAPRPKDYIRSPQNKMLHPTDMSEFAVWARRPLSEIRQALSRKSAGTEAQAARQWRNVSIYHASELEDPIIEEKNMDIDGEDLHSRQRTDVDQSGRQRGALTNSKIAIMGGDNGAGNTAQI
jgi:ion channel-forming bestrophin family protein